MGGIRVDYEELHRMAGVWSDAAHAVAGQAWNVQTTMADGDLLTSGLFDPLGAGHSEGSIAAAVDGPHGMLALAAELERDAVLLRLTVLKEQLVDDLPTQGLLNAVSDFGAGHYKAALSDAGWPTLTWLAPFTEPIAGTAGLALGGDPRLASRAAKLLLGRDDGPGYARVVDDADLPWLNRPPRDLADLVGRAGDLEDAKKPSVAVQSVLGADGLRRWIVELPGMRGAINTADPLDLHGAVVSEFGVRSAYTRSVVDAMRLAGVPQGADVMLVGHSEGGIAAADLAADPAVNGGYVTITHVLAVGSPISLKRAVGSTRVFTVENVNDIVTHLDQSDSARRPASPTWLPYQYSDDRGTVQDDHDVRRYAAHVRELDGSPNPLLREYVASASEYFSGGATSTTVATIADRPPAG